MENKFIKLLGIFFFLFCHTCSKLITPFSSPSSAPQWEEPSKADLSQQMEKYAHLEHFLWPYPNFHKPTCLCIPEPKHAQGRHQYCAICSMTGDGSYKESSNAKRHLHVWQEQWAPCSKAQWQQEKENTSVLDIALILFIDQVKPTGALEEGKKIT